jgi:hypothetical protein
VNETVGLEIEFTGDDGRKYNSLEEMLAADVEKILADNESAIERAVTSTRCPTHNKTASVTFSRTGEGFSFKIDGCCDELCASAERAASSA